MAKSQSGKPGTPELLVISRYLSMANWFGPNVLGDKISQRPRRRLTRSAMKLGTDKSSSQPPRYHLVRHLCDVVVIKCLCSLTSDRYCYVGCVIYTVRWS